MDKVITGGDRFFLLLSCCWPPPPISTCNWFYAAHAFQPREEAALYKFNSPFAHLYVDEEHPEANIFCINPLIKVKKYSRAPHTVHLSECKAAERDGIPVIISGIVTYLIDDPWLYMVSEDVGAHVENQGLVVMKDVAARFPYDSHDDGSPSLRSVTHRKLINDTMVKMMQIRCDRVGIHIAEFDLTDLSYAPEIASSMLVKQQALAAISAKKLLVDGAVGIACEAVAGLQERGVTFTEGQKADLVKSMLIMSMSDTGAKPVVPM